MTACSPSGLAGSAVAASSGWLDLQDDYWDRQGRTSIDAVAIFGGLLTISVAGRDIINDLGLFPRFVSRLVERDQQPRARLHPGR
jgi:hypothetical protein